MHLDNLASELLLGQSFATLHRQTGSTKTAIHKFSNLFKIHSEDYTRKKKLEYYYLTQRRKIFETMAVIEMTFH